MRKRIQTVRDNGLPWLVALWRGAIVGYCYATFYRPRPAYRYTSRNRYTWNPEWADAASAARCCPG
ncbi:N-acetyltransferase GCN5 [Klebsiella pneumoniae]|uniref:N-acetyltransferase GCN5 n=1 Tax=Klebsiella pneumoniae TaxID=573 RepID=A0A2X3EZ33_KLEPN|nr:N-acetyltransferase GCN5 [Klebsiella pneumoniae]